MLEKEIEAGLQTVGEHENGPNLKRWLTISMGVACGEIVTVTALAFALAKLGKELSPAIVLTIGIGYHVVAVGVAIALFRRVKLELGRYHERAIPLWLLKSFGPFLFGPYLMLPLVSFAKQIPHPSIWLACVLILGSASWYGALFLYVAALWFRNLATAKVEIVTHTPVEPDELPRDARTYLESCTSEFEALGFEILGDYRQKQNEQQFVRIFSGAGGKFIGEAVHCAAPKMKTCAMFSLLADGTYIESAPLDVGDVPFAPDKLVMRGNAGDTVAELLNSHCATVQAECAQRDTEPVSIPADKLEAVTHYGLFLSTESLVAQGVLSENPYAPLKEAAERAIAEFLPEAIGV
jgi:hypothetical protein